MSIYSVGGGGHHQYPYGIGGPINGSYRPTYGIYGLGQSDMDLLNFDADLFAASVDSFDFGDLSNIGDVSIEGLDLGYLDTTSTSSLLEGLTSDNLTPALLGEPGELDLDTVLGTYDQIDLNMSDQEIQDWLGGTELDPLSPTHDPEIYKSLGIDPKGGFDELLESFEGPSWTDTFVGGLKSGFSFLGDFIRKNPKLLEAGAGYLFSRKMKDDMKKSGYTDAQALAAATAARSTMLKKRPKWLMPVVIGGSVLVLGLVTWLAFSGD